MLIVVLELKTFIFSFMNLKLIEQVETGSNPFGICGVATAEQAISKTLALPAPPKAPSEFETTVSQIHTFKPLMLCSFSGRKINSQHDSGA
jgi:hypothetical protein